MINDALEWPWKVFNGDEQTLKEHTYFSRFKKPEELFSQKNKINADEEGWYQKFFEKFALGYMSKDKIRRFKIQRSNITIPG